MRTNDRTTQQSASMTLPSFVRRVLDEAEPLAQNTDPNNLGFGWLYYAFVCNLRPDFVVAIGSRRGFMPFCAARGLKDNGKGSLIFIDPSYSGEGHPGWGGAAWWSDPCTVQEWIAHFELDEWITHLRMTSDDAFPRVREIIGNERLGLLIIDGAHTYDNSLRDFDAFSSLMRDGFALFHDSTNPCCEVARTIGTLRARGLPLVTLNAAVGLTIVEVRLQAAVEETWGYLVEKSNRGEQLLRFARRVIRPGDQVCDLNCGCSPLGKFLNEVSLFGWDRDPRIIERLRRELPQHQWEQIEERNLPFAELPPRMDVVLGLGLSRGYASWDPQQVLSNVQYLIGRYAPRACFFESAADYHNGEILNDLQTALDRHGYKSHRELLETDLASFSRRAVLLAEREPIRPEA